jgi:prepilin signal peptidase PulO-like enzyme (type II secretory pathway)
LLLSNYLLIIILIPTDSISLLTLVPPLSTFTAHHAIYLPLLLGKYFGRCGDGEEFKRHQKWLMAGNVLLGAVLVAGVTAVRKTIGKRLTHGRGLATDIVGVLIGIGFVLGWNMLGIEDAKGRSLR